MKTLVTTSWDDGHKLDLKLARLLQKYNLAATFYISPQDREFPQKDLLTKKDIKDLSKYFEVGAHTLTHPHLSKLSASQAKQEILHSKKYLETVIHKKVTSFCYPYGDYSDETVQIIKQCGFTLARTVNRFSFSKGNSRFELPTTVHAFNHVTDIIKIAKFSEFSLKKMITYTNWEALAKDLFLRSLHTNGIFHLWGHSWEIEKHKSWGKLEEVFAFIANRKNINYVTNAKIV